MQTVLSDTSDFSRIIRQGSIYVDKTEFLYRLVSGQHGSRFFISRPRRFGKSLMLSTLEAIFQAQRDLFAGLAILKTDYTWPQVPILHLDMSSVLADNRDELKKNIVNLVRRLALDQEISIDFSIYDTPSSSFAFLLDEMFRKYRLPFVVLVDEYDAPVNRMLESGLDSQPASSLLHDFYMQFKVNDKKIRFLMMTGISKFAKLSVFSGLNNLKDLTLEPEFAGMLGYTQDEIKHYFREHITAFSVATGKSSEEILASLLDWYDGYRFSPYSPLQVTNPVSLASAIDKHRFEPFWEETGHSTLIYTHLKNRRIIPTQLNGITADKSSLDFCQITNVNSPALLFQAGYLTIARVLPNGKLQFQIPNKEISQALTTGMLSFIFHGAEEELTQRLSAAPARLQDTRLAPVPILEETLTAAFSAIPYDWTVKDEGEARRMFLFYCYLMGADILAEVHSPFGRADAVLLFADSVFVFEFKYAHSAQLALKQAEEKTYGSPFANGKRAVYLVGVNYNPKIRNIDPPCCKRL